MSLEKVMLRYCRLTSLMVCITLLLSSPSPLLFALLGIDGNGDAYPETILMHTIKPTVLVSVPTKFNYSLFKYISPNIQQILKALNKIIKIFVLE